MPCKSAAAAPSVTACTLGRDRQIRLSPIEEVRPYNFVSALAATLGIVKASIRIFGAERAGRQELPMVMVYASGQCYADSERFAGYSETAVWHIGSLGTSFPIHLGGRAINFKTRRTRAAIFVSVRSLFIDRDRFAERQPIAS